MLPKVSFNWQQKIASNLLQTYMLWFRTNLTSSWSWNSKPHSWPAVVLPREKVFHKLKQEPGSYTRPSVTFIWGAWTEGQSWTPDQGAQAWRPGATVCSTCPLELRSSWGMRAGATGGQWWKHPLQVLPTPGAGGMPGPSPTFIQAGSSPPCTERPPSLTSLSFFLISCSQKFWGHLLGKPSSRLWAPSSKIMSPPSKGSGLQGTQ